MVLVFICSSSRARKCRDYSPKRQKKASIPSINASPTPTTRPPPAREEGGSQECVVLPTQRAKPQSLCTIGLISAETGAAHPTKPDYRVQ